MRCAIIGPAYPLRGGIAQLNEGLARQLSAMGVECRIWSFSLQYPSFLFPGKTQEETGGSAPEGISIRPAINSIGPWTWARTANEISDWQPDRVIVRFWLPFMAPALAAVCRGIRKRCDAPIIGLLDNVVPHEARLGDRWLTSLFLRQCDAFAAMSSTVMADLASFDRTKPRRLLFHPVYDHFGLPLPKSEARQRLGLEQDGRYLLFFGLVRHYKGLDLLLEAMARLQDSGVKLIVAGEFYEGRQECGQLIQQLGLSGRVILRDEFIPAEEVRHYFCAADLVAQPYRTATQSGVTQIAYHFCTPMLVTDVGGLPEMVPHGKVGYVCKPDPQAIAWALGRFFTSDDAEVFRANIPAERERFSWEAFAEGLLGLG